MATSNTLSAAQKEQKALVFLAFIKQRKVELDQKLAQQVIEVKRAN